MICGAGQKEPHMPTRRQLQAAGEQKLVEMIVVFLVHSLASDTCTCCGCFPATFSVLSEQCMKLFTKNERSKAWLLVDFWNSRIFLLSRLLEAFRQLLRI